MADTMVEEADLGRAESPEIVIETSGEQKAAVEVKCRCAHCGDLMVREKLPRFNRIFGIALLVVGIVLSLFMLFAGLPLVAIGAYMGVASRTVWVCRTCAAVVDRDDK